MDQKKHPIANKNGRGNPIFLCSRFLDGLISSLKCCHSNSANSAIRGWNFSQVLSGNIRTKVNQAINAHGTLLSQFTFT